MVLEPSLGPPEESLRRHRNRATFPGESACAPVARVPFRWFRGSGDAGAIILVDRATVPAQHDVPRALRYASTRSAPAQTCVEALVHPRRERLRARREGTVSTVARFRRRLSEPARGPSDGSTTARCPPSPQVRKHPLRARTNVCGGSRSPKLYPRDGALRALSPKVNQSFVHIFSDAERVLLHLLA